MIEDKDNDKTFSNVLVFYNLTIEEIENRVEEKNLWRRKKVKQEK